MRGSGLTVGKIREGDLAEILLIERDSFPTPWTENLLRDEITSSLSRFLVARLSLPDREAVLGYIIYWLVADEIHVHNIAVRRDQRRQGIGTRLLHEAIVNSRPGGARTITLEVRRTNLAAQRLYEKFGFSVQGVRPRYYTDTGEDALIMWADIDRGASGYDPAIHPEEKHATASDPDAR